MPISFSANPFKEKSKNENINDADDAPNQECPNPSEMAVRGMGGIPTPRPLHVRCNAASHQGPNEYDERQKRCTQKNARRRLDIGQGTDPFRTYIVEKNVCGAK